MRLRQFRFVFLIIAVGGVIATLAAGYVREIQNEKHRNQLASSTKAAADAIAFSFQQNLNHLEALHAYFDTNSKVSRSQFSKFTGRLLDNASSIRALEWVPRVSASQRQALEETTRFHGYTDFSFIELGPDGQMITADNRAEYYPVLFVEPFAENQKAFGFDLGSNETRLKALQLSRDRGERVVTRRIKLVQEAGKKFGVLVIDPVYRRDLGRETVAERRESIRGFVLGVFGISNMVNGALSSLSIPENANIEIYDRKAKSGEQLLFSSHQSDLEGDASDHEHNPNYSFSYDLTLPVGGQDWEVMFFGFDESPPDSSWVVWLVVGAGLVVTMMMGLVTCGYVSRAENASHLVAERTKSLQESDDRMRDAIESLSDGFALYDADDRLVVWNQRYRDIYSESADLLTKGVKFADVLRAGAERGQYPESEGQVDEWVAERVDLHQNPKGPFEQKLPNGQWLRIEERRTSEGGYVGIRTDISALKEKEFALQESERRARKIAKEAESARTEAELANMAKSNFLATMSHEIRTPMNGVLGLAQLLTDSPLNEDQRRKVETILSSGRTLLSIINDVLDMSRIEAGGVELEIMAFSLPDLVSIIATPFQSLADDKGLHLDVSNKTASTPILKGDPVRLRQILWNLLSNGIKFTDEGRVSLSIEELTAEDPHFFSARDHTLRISISDSGAGISPDRLEVIFDPFTQEDTTITRKFGGSGLGLSIVKRLVDLMAGSVEVFSVPDEGSRFDVYIPFDRATAEETARFMNPVEYTDKARGEKLDVLVAEDNEVNALVVQAFLQKFGHAVRHVENGRLAVQEVEKSRPDLVLMDIHMPELNGIDATKMIRSMEGGKDIPIVGLTAEAFAERHAQFRSAGMDDVLTKPFTEDQLRHVVSHYGGRLSSVDEDLDVPEALIEAAAVSDLPIGDDEKFASFQEMLTPEKVREIISKAPESLNSRMDQLRHGIEISDSKQIAEATHSIRGMSGSLFAIRLSSEADIVERAASDLEEVRRLLPVLEETVRQTLQWWQDRTA